MQRLRGGLAFKADSLLCHSTLGLRVIKKKKKVYGWCRVDKDGHEITKPLFRKETCFLAARPALGPKLAI